MYFIDIVLSFSFFVILVLVIDKVVWLLQFIVVIINIINRIKQWVGIFFFLFNVEFKIIQIFFGYRIFFIIVLSGF